MKVVFVILVSWVVLSILVSAMIVLFIRARDAQRPAMPQDYHDQARRHVVIRARHGQRRRIKARRSMADRAA